MCGKSISGRILVRNAGGHSVNLESNTVDANGERVPAIEVDCDNQCPETRLTSTTVRNWRRS